MANDMRLKMISDFAEALSEDAWMGYTGIPKEAEEMLFHMKIDFLYEAWKEFDMRVLEGHYSDEIEEVIA